MNHGLVVTVAARLLPARLLLARLRLLHRLPRLHLPRLLQLITGVRPPAVTTRPIPML